MTLRLGCNGFNDEAHNKEHVDMDSKVLLEASLYLVRVRAQKLKF